MIRTDLPAFVSAVLDVASGDDGWRLVLTDVARRDDEIGGLADELLVLYRTLALSERGTISEWAASDSGFSHADLLALLEVGILSRVDEIDAGYRIEFSSLEDLRMAMAIPMGAA